MTHGVVINPFFDWEGDRRLDIPYNESVIYEAHVKGLTQLHPDVPEELRGTYAGLAHPAITDPPDPARHHRARADAGAPVHPGQHPARQGTAQLLGLQHPRLPRTAGGVRRDRPAGPAGAGVQVDGQGDAHGRHRGDPRRGLQPHRRGQPPRSDAELQGHRQPGVLPPRRGRPAVLHGLHGHRELPQRAAPALAAADHGLAALLGHRDARRRLPVRPRLDAGARVLRGGPALDLLRARAAGPGRQPGQADRRAVGRRARRLPGRQLPAPVDRVERRLPRHRPRLLARGAVARRVRQPARRLVRLLRALRPPTGREHQLRHRARRLHAATTWSPTTRSTTRPTARTTTTARATTAPGTTGWRARPTTRRSRPPAPASSATSWPRCCSARACR